ncbi:pyroglutamyl-peptidase I [Cellulomonas sp. NPDC089187]|uniref:pyroglutamyl-peptidase I n=1 Tax=Cellulomonas sp. NPDC089187 TaxID=3154970 RepID=UPI0034150F03
MTVLLTGFEPFDGQPVNASWAAVTEVGRCWSGPEALVTAQLPVSFTRAPERLRALIVEHRPTLVVAVGEAGGRGRVSIERVGINVQDARIPDEDGAQPVDVPVLPGAPTAYFSSLPIKAALLAVQDVGVPVEVSNTAGTYVCNTIAFALAHELATTGARGGFVHVPRLPEQMPTGQPSLSAELSGRALTAVIESALAHPVDVPMAAGAEH